ncbi:hypothetical protein [Sinanaerobacter chloroacetimidivorans]|uniref:Uncharacterized protein n=1 Tax=Sinanaerobacter chloroacetimidivorans TaxID=2818044 RepID=A0A8J8B186_9FIRM|nr:hypothetical protein [Sinanaerobacter chloroacetimidivorans]MBR0597401.1 hypothetical protein [Sinanaerobacter chloroacetimidivorans]
MLNILNRIKWYSFLGMVIAFITFLIVSVYVDSLNIHSEMIKKIHMFSFLALFQIFSYGWLIHEVKKFIKDYKATNENFKTLEYFFKRNDS